jgi:metal-dependent amidase/aminoacylase/carboxypeptidase family protein
MHLSIPARPTRAGHDGHMSIAAACGLTLAERRPARGRVVLLYQPSEENGRGAAAVLGDPSFDSITPDLVYALHNLPGLAKGCVALRSGVVACASRGIRVELRGETAHAAYPETGRSPTGAMCDLIARVDAMSHQFESGPELVRATVVSATLGEAEAFGSAPGTARSTRDAAM